MTADVDCRALVVHHRHVGPLLEDVRPLADRIDVVVRARTEAAALS